MLIIFQLKINKNKNLDPNIKKKTIYTAFKEVE